MYPHLRKRAPVITEEAGEDDNFTILASPVATGEVASLRADRGVLIFPAPAAKMPLPAVLGSRSPRSDA